MGLSRGSKGFLFVLLVVGGALGGLAYGFLNQAEPLDDGLAEGTPVGVEIPEDVGAPEVAEILEDAGVISSALSFRLGARFDERASRIQPGEYELVAGMDAGQILEVLSEEPEEVPTFQVTIPEGLDVDQTVERLAEAGPHDAEAYAAAVEEVALPEWVPELPEGAIAAEGLLFPDTYEFREEQTPDEIVDTLVRQTEARLREITPPEGVSPYEILIIASMIEREARLPDEQPVIASVIYNRLAEPMRLQIDATVQYAQGEHKGRLLFSDLGIDSLWNTYEADGLPPTPIAGPGRGAIAAAADPAETPFLFYVVSDLETGAHAFAETNAEHDANVAEYRRLRDEAEAAGDEG